MSVEAITTLELTATRQDISDGAGQIAVAVTCERSTGCSTPPYCKTKCSAGFLRELNLLQAPDLPNEAPAPLPVQVAG